MCTKARLRNGVNFGMLLGLLLTGGCPFPVPTEPAEFTNASVVRGGLLYDKWWTVANVDEPTSNHPLWATRPDSESNTRTGADTWRCKECHGWDYMGVDGAYGSGSHRTGFSGIYGTTLSAQEVFNLIKDASSATAQDRAGHNYGSVLSDADIWDLTKFVKQGQIDTDTVIDANGNFIGSETNGQTLYDNGVGSNTSCATCHGADGAAINFKTSPDEEYVGDLARDNPWEALHKIRFGHPGSNMPSSVEGGGSTQDAADIGAYAQTLQKQEDGAATDGGGSATAGQTIYDDRCAGCHRLGTYDPNGAFSDLSGHGNELVADLSTIDALMAGLTLTNQEIADLGAFLDAN